MNSISALLGLLCITTSAKPALRAPAEITWQAEFARTLELAESENQVVFVAVNMDGERANDRMAQQVYRDKAILSLAEKTLNLVASTSEHQAKGACPRFGTVTCGEHRAIDIRVRERVLKPDSNGFVIAPQHVFLGPDASVLLSVPYEVSATELEWCFVKALTMIDPDTDVRASSKARAPRRLLMGSVIDTAASGEAGTTPTSPPTREELIALIQEIKKGKTPDRRAKLRRIMSADEPEAREYVALELRNLKSRGSDPGKRHRDLLSDIGRLSPQSYWELVSELSQNSMDDVRAAAAAAYEQLAAPESIKDIKSALRKEKNPVIEGNWLRAMASSAPGDKKLRKDLIRNASKARQPTIRTQSIVALGYMVPDEEVNEVLRLELDSEEPDFARAAACAMAISRDSSWLEPLRARLKDSPPGELQKTLQDAIEVLVQGQLELLCGSLMAVCGDSIARPRFYGPAPRE
jgi:hypothetical protein